ncbi:hypothetical protein FFJ24_016240 [Pedobacter sp. KBS0701]|uniref:hypothetical protein n=1 Tax=Pedobacter sp. KBS0701 TaxID=2578106 RepID=UPI00110DB28D|nr:hypothetical protein [Pedobacter sp. KBS0701]QDW26281.1 hypothetical protein FFJ24_016240 [Pedobacter sp. KBS0701]
MENKKTDIETQKEDKVGVIPLSEIEGSDADSAHQDEDAAGELAKQSSKSDSEMDQQTDEDLND